MLGHPCDHVHYRLAPVRRGCDIEEGQLVGAFGLIEGGQLHRVTGIAQVQKAHTLDHAAACDIQTGDDASGQRSLRVHVVLLSPSA